MTDLISSAGRAHLRWSLVDGVGPTVFSRIVAEFGDAESALGISATGLERIKGISRDGASRILRDAETLDLEIEIAACAEHGVRLLCPADEGYPPGLHQIPDRPIILYVKGELLPTDAIAVAVVGSRRCTIYGSEQARRFGELLSGAGYTVISGLARGIDAFAHHGAVDAGGRSIGVLGCGLDEIYPPENAALAAKLLDAGGLVSELPIKTPVRAGNFPTRNRIIAGMSLGTLVIEAAARSGALITARLASEYNREVFAVPGRVQDAMSIGTNALIREGAAKLTTCLEDIVAELGDVGQAMARREPPSLLDAAAGQANDREEDEAMAKSGKQGGGKSSSVHSSDSQRRKKSAEPTAGPATLSPAEKAVYAVIPYDPVPQETLLQAAQLPPGEVIAAVTSLELKRLIRRMPGNFIVRIGVA